MYGWLKDSYKGEERYWSHILDVGFRKGSDSLDLNDDLLFDVISIDGEGLEGNGILFYFVTSLKMELTIIRLA